LLLDTKTCAPQKCRKYWLRCEVARWRMPLAASLTTAESAIF